MSLTFAGNKRDRSGLGSEEQPIDGVHAPIAGHLSLGLRALGRGELLHRSGELCPNQHSLKLGHIRGVLAYQVFGVSSQQLDAMVAVNAMVSGFAGASKAQRGRRGRVDFHQIKVALRPAHLEAQHHDLQPWVARDNQA